jgi:Zn-finger nucleic acid-binding protein
MFEGASFCQKCGHRRSRAAAEAGSIACPGCEGELRRVDLEGTILMECARCDGVWVEAEVFEKLCTDRASQGAVLHHYPGTRPPGPERVRYRRCVQCGKMMNRVNFGRTSGTVVDVCRGHGTFLDAGELHHIVDFIHGGGLDRTRARQLEELREQERRLRSLEAQAARDRGAADPHASLDLTGQLPADALRKLMSMISGAGKD